MVKPDRLKAVRERNEEIYQLAREGVTYARLAERFDLSISSIYFILHNQKVAREFKGRAEKWTDISARNAWIYQLYKDGVAKAEISRRCGLTYGHVWRIIDEARWEDEDESPVPERLQLR